MIIKQPIFITYKNVSVAFLLFICQWFINDILINSYFSARDYFVVKIAWSSKLSICGKPSIYFLLNWVNTIYSAPPTLICLVVSYETINLNIFTSLLLGKTPFLLKDHRVFDTVMALFPKKFLLNLAGEDISVNFAAVNIFEL